MRALASLSLGSLLLLSVVGCRGWTSEDPPVHLNPNMDTQAKHRPYRAENFFADGRSMRTPPEGTIARTVAGNTARDLMLMNSADASHYLTGVMSDGTVPDAMPDGMKIDAALLDRGQDRYNIYCAPCHAQHGRGNGTVASRFTVRPPDFHDDTRMKLPLSHLFRIVTHGKPLPEDLSSPDDKLNMSGYSAQIPVDDRWAIVAYVRALQHLRKNELPAAVPGKAPVAEAPMPAGEMPSGEDDTEIEPDADDGDETE